MTALTGVRDIVFKDRYSRKDSTGNAIEDSIEQSWERVAKELASTEYKNNPTVTSDQVNNIQDAFYNILKDFKFVPGGRILSGAGTETNVTYYNCFAFETLVHVHSGVFPIGTLKGRHDVLGLNGKFRPATFGSYGIQQLWSIELENGDILHATSDHRWFTPINDELEITITRNLTGKRIPINSAQPETNSSHDSVRVVKVMPTDRVEEVFCCVEPETNSITVGRGYLSSQCFVLPEPEDSRAGILKTLESMTEIMSRGGGVGINFSSLRPRGAYVKGVNGTSSGPVNWMEIFSVMTGKVIQQGGTRRGALMLMLDDDYPDILEFIQAKKIDPLTKKPVAIEYANVSVAVSDAFMQAVKNNDMWQTQFPTRANAQSFDVITKYKSYPAREIWNAICERAWATAEPGVVFMDRCQNDANTGYFEKITTVNPCITGESLVATPTGWKRVDTIQEGDEISTINGTGIVKTLEVNKDTPVFKVKFSDGSQMRATAAHQFHAKKNGQYVPTRLDALTVGDLVRVSPTAMPNNPVPNLPSMYTEKQFGFLLGTLIGNGCITPNVVSHNRVKLAVDTRQTTFNAQLVSLMEMAGGKATFSRTEGYGGHYTTQASRTLADIVKNTLPLGKSFEKRIPLEYQNTNEIFLSGLLDGLFSADGNVNLSGTVPQLRLLTTSELLATDVRRILLGFGIHARIYPRDPSNSEINGRKIIGTHKQYTVIMSGEGLQTFAEKIGLSHPDKKLRLEQARRAKTQGARWNAAITSIEYDGIETVYDLYEPTTDTWIAEGYVQRGCGEQPLGPWGVCNLGSMNLSAYVNNRSFDYNSFCSDVRTAIRLLDNVIDANYYFMEENETAQKGIRRVGLGTMGLADALIKMGIRYGSPESVQFIDGVYSILRDESYLSSCDLADEKGTFPKFSNEYLSQPFIRSLPSYIQSRIAGSGTRNALLLTQAPTGSTSLLAGVSSGIEPVFSFHMQRQDRTGIHEIHHPLVEEWLENRPGAALPDYFVSAMDLDPKDHLVVQAAIQKYIDSSISKTVNAPNNHTVEEVKELYMSAYDMGCKGVTYYRDGSRDAVLTNLETNDSPSSDTVSISSVNLDNSIIRHRPKILQGYTREMTAPEGHAHITVNSDTDGPLEVFVTVGRAGSDLAAMSEAMGRLSSLVLRLPSSLTAQEKMDLIAHQLIGIGGSRSVGFGPDRVRSLPDAIGQVLSQHPDSITPLASKAIGGICPQCNSLSLIREEGCEKCPLCGYSRC